MFQTVECVVAYVAGIDYLGGDGNTVVRHLTLGYFETARDADQALADEGFTRSSWGSWIHPSYMRADVQRLLIERKK